MPKLFLYDPDSTNSDTLRVMRRKGYICMPLTNNPDFFWRAISDFQSGVLVLLSHGNEYGPLAVAGNQGNDIDLDRFARIIKANDLTLYLLSCHTGQDPCGSTLGSKGLEFVAPKGCAVFRTIGDEKIDVFSKDDDSFPGWAGPLGPSRASAALSLP